MVRHILVNKTEFVESTSISSRVRRRQRETRRHSLEQLEGDGSPRVILLEEGEMVIGRDSSAHIRLTSGNISRQHATLLVRGTDCVLVDNNSLNGIFLNGVKVHSAVLRDGDAIQVEDNEFIYSEG